MLLTGNVALTLRGNKSVYRPSNRAYSRAKFAANVTRLQRCLPEMLRITLQAGSTACPQDFVQRCRRAGRFTHRFLLRRINLRKTP